MAKTRTKETREKKAKASALDRLNRLSEKATKPKKATMPIIRLDTPEMIAKMTQVVEKKKALKDAEAADKLAQADFRDDALELHTNQCIADSKRHSSIKLTDGQQSITFMQTSRFAKMEQGKCEEELQEIFGKQYEQFFKVTPNISINAADLSPEQINAILDVLEGQLTPEEFKITSMIVPTESYANARVLDRKVRQLAQVAESHGLAKPFTPSFR